MYNFISQLMLETVKQRILGQGSDSAEIGTALLAKQRVRSYFQSLRDQVFCLIHLLFKDRLSVTILLKSNFSCQSVKIKFIFSVDNAGECCFDCSRHLHKW